jgi:hypothetical protein
VTAIIFAVSIFVIGVFHDNKALDMISGALGIGSLLVGIGFEISEGHHRRERLEEVFIGELQKLDRTMNQVTDQFSSALKASEERQATLLERYCRLLNDPWIERLIERPGSTAMHKVWRSFLIEHAARHLDGSRRILLPEHTDGRIRIDIMGRAIYHATRYAFAYTRATRAHYEEFWGDETRMEAYFSAQTEALRKNPPLDLRRVFVVTDDLLTDPTTFKQFKKTLGDLYAIVGMNRHLFITTEEAARRSLKNQFPEQSFLVADDEFVSEAARDGIGITGEIGLHTADALALKTVYERLEFIARPALTREEIADPWIRLRTLSKYPPAS